MVNWTNVTDLGQLPAAANTATSGYFWSGMLYMLWIIIIMVLIGYGFETAILVASFLMLILAFFLTYAGLVSWLVVVQFIGIIFFMYLYILWSARNQ